MGDASILLFSTVMEKKSTKGASDKYTYGYRRFAVLGAIINLVVSKKITFSL